MTDKDAICNALEYYILVNAATEQDSERKVDVAKRCLEELKVSEKVTKDWIRENYPTMFRSINVYYKFLDRFIKESPPYEDTSNEKEAKRKIASIIQILKEFTNSVGMFDDLPI